jgi:hypothetical protein
MSVCPQAKTNLVYEDDFKTAGKKENLKRMWKALKDASNGY